MRTRKETSSDVLPIANHGPVQIKVVVKDKTTVASYSPWLKERTYICRLKRLAGSGISVGLVALVQEGRIVDVRPCTGRQWMDIRDNLEANGYTRHTDLYVEFEVEHLKESLKKTLERTHNERRLLSQPKL